MAYVIVNVDVTSPSVFSTKQLEGGRVRQKKLSRLITEAYYSESVCVSCAAITCH